MIPSFFEIISYFCKKLDCQEPDRKDLRRYELVVDELTIILSQGRESGSLSLEAKLGLFLRKPKEEQLQALLEGNFLGLETEGCTFCFDTTGAFLLIRAEALPSGEIENYFSWLERLINTYREWSSKLSGWKEFTPITSKGVDSKKLRRDLLA